MVWRKRKSSAEDEFTREAVAILREMPEVEGIEPNGELSLRVRRRPPSDEVIVNLHNHFQDLGRATPDERREQLTFRLQVIREITAFPATFDDARPHLLPSLRNPSYVAGFLQASPTSTPDPRVMPRQQPYLPFVVELVVVDQAHSLVPLRADRVEEWGVDWDTVVAVARQNLEAIDLEAVASPNVAGAVEVVTPDAYQATWLVLPHVVAELGRRVGLFPADTPQDDPPPALLALVPTRDDLLVLSSTDPPRVLIALDWAMARYRDSPRALSPVPYVVRDDAIVPWEPAGDHPCARAVGEARQFLAHIEYGHQTRGLVELFERSATDVFVAPHEMRRRPDGTTFTYTLWVETVTAALLPRADLVVMGGGDSPSLTVAWDDVQRVAGRWLDLDGTLSPPRWRVGGWPPPATVEQLRAVATEI